MKPIFIACTTCQTRLRVCNPDAIGDILPCPKCGAMVLVDVSTNAVTSVERISPSSAQSASQVSASDVLAASETFEQLDLLLDDLDSFEKPRRRSAWKTAPAPRTSTKRNPKVTAPASSIATTQSSDEFETQPAPARQSWLVYSMFVAGSAIGTVGAVLLLGLIVSNRVANELPASASATVLHNEQVASGETNNKETVVPPATVAPSQDLPTAGGHVVRRPDGDGHTKPARSETSEQPKITTEEDDHFVLDSTNAEVAEEPNTESEDNTPDIPANDADASLRIVARRPSLPRPPTRRINIDARLSDPLNQIQFDNIGVSDFLQFITELSTIPITLDPFAMRQLGRRANDPLHINQQSTSVRQILQIALGKKHLEFTADGQQLTVRRRSATPNRVRSVIFRVDDLLVDNNETLAEIADMVQQLILPNSWASAGGPATIQIEDGNLVVKHREAQLFKVLVFLEKLRVTRGLVPRSRYDSSHFDLQSKALRAEQKMDARITVISSQPLRLIPLLDKIELASGVNLLVDWQAVGRLGWTPDAELTLDANNQPLGHVLASLLLPMDLAYRVIDETTFQVTSHAMLQAQPDVEFYPAVDLVSNFVSVEALLDKLKGSLRENLVFAHRQEPGVILFDRVSGYLIVRLPQPQQQAIEAFLMSIRSVHNDR